MTREQRDDVRAAVRSPESRSLKWWAAVADQLLHSLEAAFDDGVTSTNYDYDPGVDPNDCRTEREEWERENPKRGSNDPGSRST